MSKEKVDLNGLLKNKAQAELIKEIEEWLYSIRKHKFFSIIEDVRLSDINASDNDKQGETLRMFLWDIHHDAGQKIFQKLAPEYIQQRTADFVANVESLQIEIEEMKNNYQSLN